MNILAIDTAGKTAAVAVMRDDTLLYEMASNTGLTHSETKPESTASSAAAEPMPLADSEVQDAILATAGDSAAASEAASGEAAPASEPADSTAAESSAADADSAAASEAASQSAAG